MSRKTKRTKRVHAPTNQADASYENARSEFDGGSEAAMKRAAGFNDRLEKTLKKVRVRKQEGWDG